MKFVQNGLCAALCALIVACGGQSDTSMTAPPPPPPPLKPAIASVVLTANKALLYITEPAALGDLVAHVYDSTGVEVAKSDLHFTADVAAGWSVRNDSIFPPSTEQRQPVTVHASYRVATLSGSVSPVPAGLAPSLSLVGDSTSIVTTDVVTDLSLHRWHISFACYQMPDRPTLWADSIGQIGAIFITPTNQAPDVVGPQSPIDSFVIVNAVVDSVERDPSYSTTMYPKVNNLSGLFYSGTRTYYVHDGRVLTNPAWPDNFVLYRPMLRIFGQAPDTIEVEGGSGFLTKSSLPGQLLAYSVGWGGYPEPGGGYYGQTFAACPFPYTGPGTLQEF